MIYLYELVNPLYRDISIEDHGHPFFIIDRDLHKTEDLKHPTAPQIKFQRLISKFNTIDELADYVISWDQNIEPYKTALLNQLTKEV